jgi:hypothetical protein
VHPFQIDNVCCVFCGFSANAVAIAGSKGGDILVIGGRDVYVSNVAYKTMSLSKQELCQLFVGQRFPCAMLVAQNAR